MSGVLPSCACAPPAACQCGSQVRGSGPAPRAHVVAAVDGQPLRQQELHHVCLAFKGGAQQRRGLLQTPVFDARPTPSEALSAQRVW